MKNDFQHNPDGTTTIYYASKKSKQLLYTIIDTEDFEKVSSIKNTWYISSNGKNVKYRVKATINKKKVYLYRFLLDLTDDDLVVDHIDGDTLNNTKKNLRICTTSENAQNRIQGNSRRNITYNAKVKKYRVSLFVNGERKHFGHYPTIEEAEKAAKKARKKFMPFATF